MAELRIYEHADNERIAYKAGQPARSLGEELEIADLFAFICFYITLYTVLRKCEGHGFGEIHLVPMGRENMTQDKFLFHFSMWTWTFY